VPIVKTLMSPEVPASELTQLPTKRNLLDGSMTAASGHPQVPVAAPVTPVENGEPASGVSAPVLAIENPRTCWVPPAGSYRNFPVPSMSIGFAPSGVLAPAAKGEPASGVSTPVVGAIE
jgi:hypothetical protein